MLLGNVHESLVVGRRVLEDVTERVYGDFEVLWKEEGFDREPVIAEALLSEERRLNILTRAAGKDGHRQVVVLGFDLSSRLRE